MAARSGARKAHEAALFAPDSVMIRQRERGHVHKEKRALKAMSDFHAFSGEAKQETSHREYILRTLGLSRLAANHSQTPLERWHLLGRC